MASLNRVEIIGNLGRDPEIRYTNKDIPVANFSVATTESWKVGEEWKSETSWHRVTAWRHLAEKAEKYLKKGKQVYVEGNIKYDTYEKDGVTHHTTEIVASKLILLGRKDEAVIGGGEGFNPPAMPDATDDDDSGDLPF